MASCSGSSCRHAVGTGCACECGGGNHGAKARIEWAMALAAPTPTSHQSEEADQARRAQAKARCQVRDTQQTLPKSARKPRRADATRFFEATRTVDIVDWLADHPSEAEQLNWLADQVGKVCGDALKASPGKHQRLADHFWCDVVAALVHVLDEAVTSVDALPAAIARVTVPEIGNRTWHHVRTSRETSHGNAPTADTKSRSFNRDTRAERDTAADLAEAVLEKAVEDLVSLILDGAIAGVHLTFDELILKLRLLAVLLCPDPYAHAAVWNHCVVPLLKLGIVVRARRYLPRFIALFQTAWRWTP